VSDAGASLLSLSTFVWHSRSFSLCNFSVTGIVRTQLRYWPISTKALPSPYETRSNMGKGDPLLIAALLHKPESN
jgi:hypothetical protein